MRLPIFLEEIQKFFATGHFSLDGREYSVPDPVQRIVQGCHLFERECYKSAGSISRTAYDSFYNLVYVALLDVPFDIFQHSVQYSLDRKSKDLLLRSIGIISEIHEDCNLADYSVLLAV